MRYHQLFSMALVATCISSTLALGINCRGSGLCKMASWEDKSSMSVMQILRDALYETKASNGTVYKSGDHIICIAGSETINLTGSSTGGVNDPLGPTKTATGSFTMSATLHTGGICLFLQDGPSTLSMTLDQIKPLADALLVHGCGTCGSVPVHFVDQGSNDPSPGILTFNYVAKPYCVGSCISGDGSAGPTSKAKRLVPSPKMEDMKRMFQGERDNERRRVKRSDSVKFALAE